MNKVVIGIIAGMLLGVVIGWQRVVIQSLESDLTVKKRHAEQLRQKRDELASDLAESEADKEVLMAELKHSEAVLSRRDADLLRSKQALAELSERLRGLRNTDEEYKTWSDARVPDSVIRLLRHTRKPGNSENQVPENAATRQSD